MSRFPSFSRPPPKQFNARRPQPVAEVLNRTDAFAALRAGVEQIAALEKDLRDAAAGLSGDERASRALSRKACWRCLPAHNALAARLRHLEPRLLADLQQRGWPVNALRIRVRPQPAKEPPPVKQARMTPVGADALQALSESLAPRRCRKRWRKWRPASEISLSDQTFTHKKAAQLGRFFLEPFVLRRVTKACKTLCKRRLSFVREAARRLLRVVEGDDFVRLARCGNVRRYALRRVRMHPARYNRGVSAHRVRIRRYCQT